MKHIDVPTAILKEISGPDNFLFAIKVLIYLSLIVSGIYITHLGGSYWVAGILLLGLAFAHGVELQHQALHGAGFTSSVMNRIIGVILGLPMLVSYSSYQHLHLIHHNKVGTEDDTEFFEFNTLSENSSLFTKISSLLLVSHYREFLTRTIKSIYTSNIISGAPEIVNSRIRLEYLFMLSLLLAYGYLSFVHGPEIILHYWLIPLLVVAAPVHTFLELPEHFGCENKSEDILQNTRTIRSSSFLTWYTNGNNFHVEHHMFPLVRPENLSILNGVLSKEIRFQNNTYLEFFLRLPHLKRG